MGFSFVLARTCPLGFRMALALKGIVGYILFLVRNENLVFKNH